MLFDLTNMKDTMYYNASQKVEAIMEKHEVCATSSSFVFWSFNFPSDMDLLF